MDTISENIITFVEEIAQSNGRLNDLLDLLSKYTQVLHVSRNFDFRNYPLSGTVIESYLEVELKDGKSLTWALEIRWNESYWEIETNVLQNTSYKQYVVREFPERHAENFEQFIRYLREAVGDLVSFIPNDLIRD